MRTNSESILAVTAPDDSRDFARSIAITSSIYPDPDTHIEVVTYGRAGDAMSFLFTLLTGRGTSLTRPLLWLGQALRHPIRLARTLWPFKWSQRTVILLVMQTLDNAIRLRSRRRLLGGGVRLQTEQDPERPIPTFIPAANAAAERIAEKVGGMAQSGTTESVFNIPTTAHILGGAAIGADADARRRRCLEPRLRLRGPDRLRRLGGAGEPGRQPEPHDHRARRAGDEPRPAARLGRRSRLRRRGRSLPRQAR